MIGYALKESLRRRVFLVVLVLTAAFLGPLRPGSEGGVRRRREPRRRRWSVAVDERELTGATMFGLSMFATLFLGAVLAAFLTLSTVRGDAERGLLQPLVVRPIGRSTLLVGRFAAAAAVCAVYVVVVYAGTLLITWQIGGLDAGPDRRARPPARRRDGRDRGALAARLGLPFGHGQRHRRLHGLRRRARRRGCSGRSARRSARRRSMNVAQAASWALPFEALYQDGLDGDHRRPARVDTESPSASARSAAPRRPGRSCGRGRSPTSALVGGAALAAFARKDL